MNFLKKPEKQDEAAKVPKGEDAVYNGTVRMVTEEDLKNDPRLVGASVVAGQLYDFSNLEGIDKQDVIKNSEDLNRAKADQEEKKLRRAKK